MACSYIFHAGKLSISKLLLKGHEPEHFQVELLGLSLLTSAFGVLTCIRGLSAFLGPPLGGFVIDATSPAKSVNGNLFMQVIQVYKTAI